MEFEVRCAECGVTVWVRGVYEPDTNALELDWDDPRWAEECCEHLKNGGDFTIVGETDIEEDPV